MPTCHGEPTFALGFLLRLGDGFGPATLRHSNAMMCSSKRSLRSARCARMSVYDLEVGAAETGTIVLTLQGCLDGEAGRTLMQATEGAAANRASRIEIVLDGLESFTEEGAAALGACARMHKTVPGGVALRAGGGVGRQALLAACSQGESTTEE